MVLVVFQKLSCNGIFTINCISQNMQNFTLISNPLKKFLKNVQKKVISKNVTEICTFSTFTHVRQTCFTYNFFIAFFQNFFNGLFRHQGQAGNAELEFLNNLWGLGAE